ncbi:MAG: ATP-binding protein [Candidatus Thermoplasmatota archaeon]|nr:ATP-binding protein [Candidatus Thermoplasmatota archaeon]
MISKDDLRQIIMQQKNQEFNIKETIPREKLLDIEQWINNDNRILILTGLRRSGKSTILRQMMQKHKNYCYVNFEHERFIDFNAQNFEILHEVLIEIYEKPTIYFFDEIQNIDKFETFVRRLHDQDKKIILTGSNATMLSKELGTHLTGRYKPFEIYPFSFREFLKFNKIHLDETTIYLTEKKVQIIKLFQQYLLKGGMPEYLKNNDIDYIKTTYDNIIYRDIIVRYRLKNERVFRRLVNLLSTNISSKITYNSLKNTVNLSNAITVKQYISYLQNSYLFFELQQFDYSLKKQLNTPKKIYTIDPMFHTLCGMNYSENKGRILENIVFIELKRLSYEIYYFSNKNECDFVIKKDNKIVNAIQVCYMLNEENKKREIQGLCEAMDTFQLKTGLLLTNEQEEEILIDNKKIMIIPVWKWMITDNKS